MAKGNCEFKGTGAEYFVPVFLHLFVLGTITFGIYLAWAWVWNWTRRSKNTPGPFA